MRIKPILIIPVVAAAVVGVGFLAQRWERPKVPTVCQICGRNISKQTEFRIEITHRTIYTCCARCAMHYMINHPGAARKEWATDLDTGRLILAKSAYYDEGGDVQYCTLQRPAIQRVPDQGVKMRVYDRCLPVMVAFASKPKAEAYRQHHGGRVVTYAQALEDVRNH
jgi:hypothetical protein